MTPQRAFDEYHQAVYSLAYRLTQRADLAEDITQECFLALIRDPDRFDLARGSVKTWLFGVARNLAFKQYRDYRAEKPLLDDATGMELPGDPDIASSVQRAIAQLPRLQREALILFEYEGATLAEIAEVVRADVGSVKARLHRARETLRRALAPYRGVRNRHGTF